MLRRVQVETDADVGAKPKSVRQWHVIVQAENSASERRRKNLESNPRVEFHTWQTRWGPERA